MSKAKNPADAGDGRGNASPRPSVRNAHTSSLVIAGKDASFSELKPGQSYELREPTEGEDPRAVLEPKIWAAARERPSVRAWLKRGLLVEEG